MEWSTTHCYLKGEAIRQLLSIILFIFWFWLEKQFGGRPMSARNYIPIKPIYDTYFTRFWLNGPVLNPNLQAIMCIPNKWKKCYRLIQYLPIESASNFIRDNSVSDLHLILAMVELNGCRQKVKTISTKKVKIYSWHRLSWIWPQQTSICWSECQNPLRPWTWDHSWPPNLCLGRPYSGTNQNFQWFFNIFLNNGFFNDFSGHQFGLWSFVSIGWWRSSKFSSSVFWGDNLGCYRWGSR